jgi:hypothetical protein
MTGNDIQQRQEVTIDLPRQLSILVRRVVFAQVSMNVARGGRLVALLDSSMISPS